MWSGGSEPDDCIARLSAPAIDDGVLLDDPDAEAGEVVVVAVIDARHFRSLAAHQCGAGQGTTLDDSADDGLGHLDTQLAGRVVVQKKQWFRALHDDVVGAHCDQIDPDRVMTAGIDGEAQLRANPVGARDQHWMPVALRQLHQRAEAPDARQHLRALRPAHEGLDSLDELVAGVDVDATVAIGQTRAFFHDMRGAGSAAVRQLRVWYCTYRSAPWRVRKQCLGALANQPPRTDACAVS